MAASVHEAADEDRDDGLGRRGEARTREGHPHASQQRRVRHPRAAGRGREMTHARLTLRSIRAVAVEVPMKRALGTSRAVIRAAPLVLVDVETEEGVTGRAYLFCYVPAAAAAIASFLAEVERVVKGRRVAPLDLLAQLTRRFTLIGVQGIVRMEMAGFVVACWEALAIAAGRRLVALLGGTPRPIRAYNSNGLGLMALDPLAKEADELLEGGFKAVKLRLGYDTLAGDIAAVRTVRARVPPVLRLMVDYNQALSVAEALERGRALDAEGVYCLEEPIPPYHYPRAAPLPPQDETPSPNG